MSSQAPVLQPDHRSTKAPNINSLFHFGGSRRRFTVRARATPVRVPIRCSFVLVDCSSQMPISHVEPRLPSWAPDSLARSLSGSVGLVIIDRTRTRNQLCLKILIVYCPPFLDSCHQKCDQRHVITLEDHPRVTQLLKRGKKHLGRHVEQDLSLEPSNQECTWCCCHTEQV